MIDERESNRPSDDVKEMTIAGCRVRFTYCSHKDQQWVVKATMLCGTADRQGEQSIVTDAYYKREDAERHAIQEVTTLLGQHTDRSHSRVRNWT
jgi:hypothetical protein